MERKYLTYLAQSQMGSNRSRKIVLCQFSNSKGFSFFKITIWNPFFIWTVSLVLVENIQLFKVPNKPYRSCLFSTLHYYLIFVKYIQWENVLENIFDVTKEIELYIQLFICTNSLWIAIIEKHFAFKRIFLLFYKWLVQQPWQQRQVLYW